MSGAAVLTAIVAARSLTDLGRRSLEHLLALGPGVEVIFVPDYATAAPDPRVVVLASGPVPVGDKRELALGHAQGAFIGLLDDDAYPHPSWLTVVLDAFASDPGIAAVCGPTLPPPDATPLERDGDRVYTSPLVAGPHLWRYEPRPARDVDDAPMSNLVLRREVALDVGLASEFHPGEDTVVCDRLVRAGHRIRYVPAAIVFHSRRPLWIPHLRQLWRFARRRGSFARRFGGNSRRLSYAAPTTLLLALSCGWLLPDPGRKAWVAGLVLYGGACAAFGRSRQLGSWLRVSAGIPASHATYGLGYLLGLAGLRLPEE